MYPGEKSTLPVPGKKGCLKIHKAISAKKCDTVLKSIQQYDNHWYASIFEVFTPNKIIRQKQSCQTHITTFRTIDLIVLK